jgi:hypothetical protein
MEYVIRVAAMVLVASTLLGPAQASVGEDAHDREYQQLLTQFLTLSQSESPLAYIRLVAEPVVQDPSDKSFTDLVALLKPHVQEEPRAALLYAALLSAQAHKPLIKAQAGNEGLSQQQITLWRGLDKDPMMQQANTLLTSQCQQQNLQACMSWFFQLVDLGTPIMMAGSATEQNQLLTSLVQPENEVRRVAIMNYAQQPSPALASLISSLYTKGLAPIPPEQAVVLGFVRDAKKAAQWQQKVQP